MKFRIIKIGNEYFPQVLKVDPEKWITISNLNDYLSTIEEAEELIKKFIDSGESDKLPKIVKEFEYSNELVTRS